MLSRALLEQPSKKSCVNLTVLEFDLSFYFSYSIASVGSVFLLISMFSLVGHFQTLYSLVHSHLNPRFVVERRGALRENQVKRRNHKQNNFPLNLFLDHILLHNTSWNLETKVPSHPTVQQLGRVGLFLQFNRNNLCCKASLLLSLCFLFWVS